MEPTSSAVGRKRIKPPLVPVDYSTRLRVTLAFWAITLIGVPYWYKTTTIERQQLPPLNLNSLLHDPPCYLKPPIILTIRDSNSADRKLANYLLAQSSTLSSCLDLSPSASTATPTHYAIIEEQDPLAGSRILDIKGRTARIGKDSSLEVQKEAAEWLLGVKDGKTAGGGQVVKFAKRYNLVFSLLNQDATKGDALLEWEIQHLLEKHLKPLLTSLEPLHEFNIETRIQYFAPLSVNINDAEDGNGKVVEEGELRAFVNSAEWNIGSLDSSNAFTTPHWGGLVIFSPPSSSSSPPNLSPSFNLFRNQLSTLLGVPSAPPSQSKLNAPLEQWQIDAMIRSRLNEVVKETVETVKSIEKLVEDLPNVRVGKEVQRDVGAALSELNL
ncbi:GPI-anchor transamidase subunit S, partial [Phenoliferia sp. Uapishka_3]